MIKRRQFLISMGLLSVTGVSYSLLKAMTTKSLTDAPLLTSETMDVFSGELVEGDIKDHIYKISHFDHAFSEDIFLPETDNKILIEAVDRMARLQQLVGHGNFSILSYDEMLKYAKNYSQIGEFTPTELNLFERIFSEDAQIYGFMGSKVVDSITAMIDKNTGVKIAGSGNYLFKGDSHDMYIRLKKDIGDSLILTSGIRSIVKQMYLFLAKVKESNGNLSMASRSLAPPGHSYHAIGDFDVGNAALGSMNFTKKFADTDEFKKLVQLGYISIRYTEDNQLGVRYEPWHIKVV
ncbi:MAG: M15 family metallopeptidase [Gammaproteobacteria bacterium]|nr:M15 family metallopeptidase [Gammaproteobacteria bacterium]